MAIPAPVSFWNFDETSGNAADAVASNTLTNNASTPYVSGLINNCIDLERGSSQYMSILDATQSGLDITPNLSVSLWVNLESAPGADMGLVSKANFGTGADLSYLLYYTAAGKIQFYIPDASGNVSNPETTSAYTSTATWQHFVAVFNSASPTTMTFYVNGSSVGVTNNSTANTGSIRNSAYAFYVGAYGVNVLPTAFADGKIDMLGIWNVVLSAQDASDLYNGGAGIQYPFSATSSVKTWDSLANASIKTVDSLARASVKTVNGLA